MSFTYRLGRSLLPSAMSAISCIFLGVGLVFSYLVALSLSLGTSLPELFEGEWGIVYTNHIVQPLLAIFADLTFNKVLYVVLWGFAGLVVFFLLEYGVSLLKAARTAEHDIQFTPEGIVRHPGMGSFLAVVLWRAGVLAVFAPLLIIALWSPLQQLADLAPQAVLGELAGIKPIFGLALLALKFALAEHLIVVLLRLLTGRMRLFSDDPV